MTFYKFHEDDLFLNTVEAHPEFRFYIQSGSVYINDSPHMSGAHTDNIIGVPRGFVSLYEYNIDRPEGSKIYPFIVKGGKLGFFSNTNSSSFNSFKPGTIVTSSYNMSASISRFYFDSTNRNRILALENVYNHYSYLSPQYQYSSSFGNKATQTINLLTIPSILYGSSIKKGTVNLKYYVSGTLIGELSDYRRNGDLVQVGPIGSTGSGSVAGSVLYNEGFVSLTGSWNLDQNSIKYDPASATTSKWIHFGFGTHSPASIELTTLSASFSLEYSGINKFQTMTMLAHAKYGELNHSTNPTFVTSSGQVALTGSFQYIESDKEIRNVVSSSFSDKPPEMEKTTYLSKVGIYDKDYNLIGIAKMATPVRKTETDQYTFKLKLDI